MIKVAINGFGRIGRMVLRSIIENKIKNIKVIAINNKTENRIASHKVFSKKPTRLGKRTPK